jgi:hypothetical protein
MNMLHDERGGVVAKLLGLIVVLALLAGGALYLYAKQQQPLSFDTLHVATSDHERDPGTVPLEPGASIYVATFIHNDGRLPVTLEGLSQDPLAKDDPFVPLTIGLGNGKTPTPEPAGFDPPALDPGDGIGVVIAFAVNPVLACSRFTDTPSEPLALPPVELRFTTYGVETTQVVPLGKGAPTIDGLTRSRCEAALP